MLVTLRIEGSRSTQRKDFSFPYQEVHRARRGQGQQQGWAPRVPLA